MLSTVTPKQETLDRIVGELQTLDADIAAATRARGIASLEHEEGVAGADKRKQQAQSDIDRLAQRRKDLEEALLAAQAREKAARLAAMDADKGKAWKRAVDLASKRNDHIAKLEKSLAQFAADYIEALRINDELVGSLPKNPDSHAAITDRFVLETALRRELTRNGLAWAFTWPYGVSTLPELMPQFEGALHVVSQWAEANKAEV